MVFVAAVALSLSIGWGIRGNFGHETGAMIPGALAALAALVLARREDWLGRAGSFAFFGALGWSFGGSISYMQVIAYTHSGHSLSVFYGFACLFVIGFLWGIFGGVGTALPACLSAAELRSLYPLTFLIFGAWWAQDFLLERVVHVDPAFRQRDPLYWYDTDWLGITVALGMTLLYAAIRRRFDFAVRLASTLCLGWWGGFVFFVLFLGWRMTPPRGDNWAGCLGMAMALCWFLARARQGVVLQAGIVAGTMGGIGFAVADCAKLLGITTGLQTNWHSVLEQSYGFINGAGIALAMLKVREQAPPLEEETHRGFPWERVATLFVLLGVTYLNLQKNVETWVKASAVPAEMYGWTARAWFDTAYLLASAVFVVLAWSKYRPALWSDSNLGKVQLFYLVFLWWMIVGNFERALVGFAPQRLITEGVIYVNALICSGLVLLGIPAVAKAARAKAMPSTLKLSASLVTLWAVTSLLCWACIRSVGGDTQIGYASRHVRFGPNATATTQKPVADKPHP